MNRNEFLRMTHEMRILGLAVPRLMTVDMVRHHNRGSSGETRKHWICKCITSKILYDAQHPHFTEYEFPDGTVADIYDVKSKVAIEFETDIKKESAKRIRYMELVQKRKVRDLIIIDVMALPDDIIGIEREVRRKLGV